MAWNGWIIFGLLLSAYIGVYLILRRRKELLGGSLEFTGPLLLVRTQLGKRAIERVARPKRFWNFVADVGIILTWIVGLMIFALLVWTLVTYVLEPKLSAETAPPLEFLIGLPGVNPLIPLGYGIAALILALVIHEGSHGVMAYVAKMRVKSLGLVFFIVPIGAFVEPHDEDLMKATAREKNRVFAAGPTSNIILATVAGLLLATLFVGQMSIANDGDGVVVGTVEESSGAALAGLAPGDVLIAFPSIILYEDRSMQGVEESVDISNRTVYSEALAATKVGDNITITYLRNGDLKTATAVLGDYHAYVARIAPGQETDAMRERGFLGVSAVGLDTIDVFRDALARPFASLPAFLFYIAYPFFIFTQGIDVLAPPYSELFTISGPLAALPVPVFFGIASLLYWIVWLNLMLGTFNALPAGPLDGGQMLKATLSDRLMRRYKVDADRIEVERREMGGLFLKGKDEETQRKLDRVDLNVSRTTRTLGYFILGLILLPVIAPPIIRLLG